MATGMENLRKYGSKPFRVAVIHGGPGAPGEMAPVARELCSIRGVFEPLQTESTLEGQVRELYIVLKKNADLPVTLIGWSWEAMLSFIFAARHLSPVRKLVLVGSVPFEEKYAGNIMTTRLARLNEAERAEVLSLMRNLNDPAAASKNALMARLGKLLSRVDSFDPLPYEGEVIECQYDIYQSVWEQAKQMRNSGQLLELGKKIRCPVVAMNGDYDPHPWQGVRDPLSRILKDFRFILLEKCGHRPWAEKAARSELFGILRNEVES